MHKHRLSDVFVSFSVVLLTFICVNIRASPTETPSSNTTPIVPTKDIFKKSTTNQTGDVYLDDITNGCFTKKDAISCLKYKTLKYIHRFASPLEGKEWRREFALIGPVKLVALPQGEVATMRDPLFEETTPRSTDSEVMKLIRFTLREMERFVRSYGFAISIPSSSADDVSTPRIIDEDFFTGTLKEAASRGKKKTLMFLLPLISFFHLKALLVPILLSVLFIKKILMLGVVFLPSLLSLVKFCKPTHHHPVHWYSEPEPVYDYHEYTPHYGKEYASRRRSRQIKPQDAPDLVYQAYAPNYANKHA